MWHVLIDVELATKVCSKALSLLKAKAYIVLPSIVTMVHLVYIVMVCSYYTLTVRYIYFKIKLSRVFFAVDYQPLVLDVFENHWYYCPMNSSASSCPHLIRCGHLECQDCTTNYGYVLVLQSSCQFLSTWLISKQNYFLLRLWITLILVILYDVII